MSRFYLNSNSFTRLNGQKKLIDDSSNSQTKAFGERRKYAFALLMHKETMSHIKSEPISTHAFMNHRICKVSNNDMVANNESHGP